MNEPKQTLIISISAEIVNWLQHFATEQHIPVEDVAADLLSLATPSEKT